MVSFSGWVLATKTSGTLASTSISPEESESFSNFVESDKTISLAVITSSTIKSGLFKSMDKSSSSILPLGSFSYPIS